MVGRGGVRSLTVLAFLVGAACSSSSDRPPGVDTCSGCGGGADDGSADAATCVPNPALGSTVSGNLSVFADDAFASIDPFAGTAELSILGEPCGLAKTTFTPGAAGGDGGAGASGAAGAAADVFQLHGAKALPSGHANWLRMRQISGAGDLLPTIMPVSTTNDVEAPDYFAFVKTQVVDAIATTAGKKRDPAKAQIFVQLINQKAHLPAPGVQISVAGAEAIVYAANGSWAANAQGTDDTGYVLALNVTADATEAGTPADVSTSSNADVFTAQLVAGHVTWFQAGLSF